MNLRDLRAAPVTIPTLAAVAVLAWFAADQGGYGIAQWAPGLTALILLGGVMLVIVPNAWGDVPPVTRVAIGALAGYTAWSFASIIWANDAGAAWEGSLRTLLYLVIFSLFALWRQRPATGLALIGLWVLAVEIVFLVVLVRMGGSDTPRSLFGDDRLTDPTGYPNATAALALMAFFPAVILSAGRRVLWPLRAALAGGAVALLESALMTQSRGATLAVPIVAVVVLIVVPGRLRIAGMLALIGAGAAAAAPATLKLTDALGKTGNPADQAATAVQLTLLAVLVVGGVAGAIAAWETLRPPGPQTARQLKLTGQWLAGLVAITVVAGGLVAAGNPVHRVQSAYDSFKGGYDDNNGQADRLVGGLGSNRYDFYRVGLDAFQAHPLAGIGTDNFQQTYLREGTSEETPRYPHSIEIRALAQTGIVGALLLLGALAAMLAAAWKALRGQDELGAAVTGAALTVGVYWLVHGSADWFFEYAGLGSAAFAFFGLVCAMVPRPDPPVAFVRRFRTAGEALTVAVMAVVLAVFPLSLWLADNEVSSAGSVFAGRPAEAFKRLDRAASLNPFAATPYSVAGSIALRFDNLARADNAFRKALQRVPDDQYSTLERGAIASAAGRPADALRLLRRAVALAPRDAIAKEALAVVQDGGTLDVQNLNRRILLAAQEFGR